MSFIVAGNWKMNKGPKETAEFFAEFNKKSVPKEIEVLFFVSAVNASTTGAALAETAFGWGSQNIFPAASGAFTGETSPTVMQELGARYTLVGHSERRSLFAETDEQTNFKIHGAQKFGLSPILCIGETLPERKQNSTLEVLNRQLISALSNVDVESELHIAYEPVWAIGTGEVATVEQVGEAHRFIRQFLSDKFPKNHEKMKILYGGSVKPENAAELASVDQVSGFLIGGASLDPTTLHQVIGAVKV